MLHTFRKGGVHPPESKLTASGTIIPVELPREVVITFAQHIGAPAKCELKKGDHVNRGDLVAAAGGFVSANVHASISGTVTKVDKYKTAFGLPVDTVTITATDEDHQNDLDAIAAVKPLRTDEEIAALDSKALVSIIDAAGIVGLGGATFPTKVKLSPPPGSKAEVLIINAVECEPYLTNDHALMLQHPDEIIAGVQMLMKAAGVNRAIIGIEANKGNAIELLTSKAASDSRIEVMGLKVKYPQGGEKQLIDATIGKEVPSGALPIATGAIVQNVATAYAVYEAVKFGKPLIDRVVTITGPSVAKPGNYLAAIGTNLKELIDVAAVYPPTPARLSLAAR